MEARSTPAESFQRQKTFQCAAWLCRRVRAELRRPAARAEPCLAARRALARTSARSAAARPGRWSESLVSGAERWAPRRRRTAPGWARRLHAAPSGPTMTRCFSFPPPPSVEPLHPPPQRLTRRPCAQPDRQISHSSKPLGKNDVRRPPAARPTCAAKRRAARRAARRASRARRGAV